MTVTHFLDRKILEILGDTSRSGDEASQEATERKMLIYLLLMLPITDIIYGQINAVDNIKCSILCLLPSAHGDLRA